MRSNGSCSVTSTDVLIAMLSSDLRGSWAEAGGALRGHRPAALTDEPAPADEPVPADEPAPVDELAPADQPAPPTCRS